MDIQARIDANRFLSRMDDRTRAWLDRMLAEPRVTTEPAEVIMDVLGALLALVYGSASTREQRVALLLTLTEGLAEGAARALAADLTESEWLAQVQPANKLPC